MNTRIPRIEYAISIKHWCDRHPNASDDELRSFLNKVEKQILDDQVNRKPASKEIIE